MIKAWSMSRLDVYESCPYRAYLQYVERIPTPELVPPPGKDEHPLHRGLRVHTAAERFVTEEINLSEELSNFNNAFHIQKNRFHNEPHNCIVEQEWAFDDNWRATGWSSVTTWGRLKLDWGFVDHENKTMEIVDYKTGKKYPPKHIQQGQLYGLVSSIRYPEIENFNVSFWYVDDPNPETNTLDQTYSRIQLQIFKDDFDRRAHTMTQATDFPPRSSAYACRFCPYGEGRDGNKYCEYRYSFDN